MSGLTDNFLFDPLLGQPFLRAKREDGNDNLFAPVAIAPSELDIRPFGLVVVLCLVKSKGHRPLVVVEKGRPIALTTNAPAPRPA